MAVERRGKHQVIRLDDGAAIHVHFRMDGDWEVATSSAPRPRAARVTIDTTTGVRVSLVDPRALSLVRYYARGDDLRLDLGPEADDPRLTPATLREALARRRGSIKPVLLDQHLLAGVGNIYAAEALWRSRIHPALRASALSATRVADLIRGIRAALAAGARRAARYRGSSRTAPFAVYGREGEACRRCGGTIRRIPQAGRSTYFCPGCQRR
jgi:formamidopyrimidine-DNA glycosylase